MNYHYKLSIENDFKNSYRFIQLSRYGKLLVIDICAVSSRSKYQVSTDQITIRLNGVTIGTYDNKTEARALLTSKLKSIPKELNEYKSILLEEL